MPMDEVPFGAYLLDEEFGGALDCFSVVEVNAGVPSPE